MWMHDLREWLKRGWPSGFLVAFCYSPTGMAFTTYPTIGPVAQDQETLEAVRPPSPAQETILLHLNPVPRPTVDPSADEGLPRASSEGSMESAAPVVAAELPVPADYYQLAWQAGSFSRRRRHPELYQQLAGGQCPRVVLFTCVDSRIQPDLIFNSRPGDIFMVRNVGNVVAGSAPSSEAAALEFAVNELLVRDLIVLGHSDCGAMKGRISGCPFPTSPSLCSWLTHEVQAARESDAALEEFTQSHLRQQLDRLLDFPGIQRRVEAGTLRLHGWYYYISTGQIQEWDPQRKRFHQL